MRFGRIVLVCVLLCVLVCLCEGSRSKTSNSKSKDKSPSHHHRSKHRHDGNDSSSSSEEETRRSKNDRRVSKHRSRGSKEILGAHRETINAFLEAEKKHERHKHDKSKEKLSQFRNVTSNKRQMNSTLKHGNVTSNNRKLNSTLTHGNFNRRKLNSTHTHGNVTYNKGKLNSTLNHGNLTSNNRKLNSTHTHGNLTSNNRKLNSTLNHGNLTSNNRKLNSTHNHGNLTSNNRKLNSTLNHGNLTSNNRNLNLTLNHGNLTSNNRKLNSTLTHGNLTSNNRKLNSTLTHLNSSTHEALKQWNSEDIIPNLINTDDKKRNSTYRFEHKNRTRENSKSPSGSNVNIQEGLSINSSNSGGPPIGWIINRPPNNQVENGTHSNSSVMHVGSWKNTNTSTPLQGWKSSSAQDGRNAVISHIFPHPQSSSPVSGYSQNFNPNNRTNVKTFPNIGWNYNQSQPLNARANKEITGLHQGQSTQIGWSYNPPYNQPTFNHYGNYDPGFSRYVKKKNKKNKFKIDLSLEDLGLEDVNWSEVIKEGGTKIHAKLKELLAEKKIAKLPSRGLYSALFPKADLTLPSTFIENMPNIGNKGSKLYIHNTSSTRVFANLASDKSGNFMARKKRELSPQGQAMADAINKFLLSERDCNETLDARKKRDIDGLSNSKAENKKEPLGENESMSQNIPFNSVEAIVRSKFGISIYNAERETLPTISSDNSRKSSYNIRKNLNQNRGVYKNAYNLNDSGPMTEPHTDNNATSPSLKKTTQNVPETPESINISQLIPPNELINQSTNRQSTTFHPGNKSHEFGLKTSRRLPSSDSTDKSINMSFTETIKINTEFSDSQTKKVIDQRMLAAENRNVLQLYRSNLGQSEIKSDQNVDKHTNGSRYLYSVLPKSDYLTEPANVDTEISSESISPKENFSDRNIYLQNNTELFFENESPSSPEFFGEEVGIYKSPIVRTTGSTESDSLMLTEDSFETMNSNQVVTNRSRISQAPKTETSTTTSTDAWSYRRTATVQDKGFGEKDGALRDFKTPTTVALNSEVTQSGKNLIKTVQTDANSNEDKFSTLLKRTSVEIDNKNQEVDKQADALPHKFTVDHDQFEHKSSSNTYTTEANNYKTDEVWYTSTKSYVSPNLEVSSSQSTRSGSLTLSSIRIHAVHEIGSNLGPIIPKIMSSMNTPEPLKEGGLIIQAPTRKLHCPPGTKRHRGRCRAVWS